MDHKIRVIHFIDRLKRGGTQAVLYEWAKNVDKTKVQFDFLTFMDSDIDYVEEFQRLGCNVYQISPLHIKTLPRFMKDLNSFFDQNFYHVAHGHSKSKNVLFLYAAKKHGINVRISHSHSSKFQSKAVFGEILKPLIKLTATDYFACSKEAALFLYGKGAVKKNEVVIIPNGIDTHRFRFDISSRNDIRTEFGIENSFLVGHVGRFMLPKNHTFIIQVFHEIKKRCPDAKLILVGSGEAQRIEQVKRMITEYGIEDSVILTGERTDIPKLMSAMDVFLMPSLYEGLPVVGVEAQASGLPCIFSDVITREVSLLRTAEYLPLDKAPAEWAGEVLKYKDIATVRENKWIDIYNAGFDSVSIAARLQEEYRTRIITANERVNQ